MGGEGGGRGGGGWRKEKGQIEKLPNSPSSKIELLLHVNLRQCDLYNFVWDLCNSSTYQNIATNGVIEFR